MHLLKLAGTHHPALRIGRIDMRHGWGFETLALDVSGVIPALTRASREGSS
jgi:hypothetical protein